MPGKPESTKKAGKCASSAYGYHIGFMYERQDKDCLASHEI